MANCTECVSYIEGQPECGRGIKIGKLPQKTVCRKYLTHKTCQYGEKGGGERHFLQNLNGRMFDITEQVMGKAKKKEDKK